MIIFLQQSYIKPKIIYLESVHKQTKNISSLGAIILTRDNTND